MTESVEKFVVRIKQIKSARILVAPQRGLILLLSK